MITFSGENPLVELVYGPFEPIPTPGVELADVPKPIGTGLGTKALLCYALDAELLPDIVGVPQPVECEAGDHAHVYAEIDPACVSEWVDFMREIGEAKTWDRAHLGSEKLQTLRVYGVRV